MLSIIVNGRSHVCAADRATVADVLRDLSLEGKRIAVERNGEIVPRSQHACTPLEGGDQLEVVVAVGGG